MDWRTASAKVVELILTAAGGFDRVGTVAMRGMRLQTERLLCRMLVLRSQRRYRRIESGTAMLVRMMVMKMVEPVVVM